MDLEDFCSRHNGDLDRGKNHTQCNLGDTIVREDSSGVRVVKEYDPQEIDFDTWGIDAPDVNFSHKDF